MAAVTPIVERVGPGGGERPGRRPDHRGARPRDAPDRSAHADPERLLDRLAESLELPDAVVSRLQNTRLGLESLAPVIAAGVESRIRDAVERFVASPEGTQLLLRTIEVAHERSVLLLRDEMDQLPNVIVTEGEVRLTFVPILAEVLRSLVNSGLDVLGIERQIPAFDSTEDATVAVQRLAAVVGRDLPPDFRQVRIASRRPSSARRASFARSTSRCGSSSSPRSPSGSWPYGSRRQRPPG